PLRRLCEVEHTYPHGRLQLTFIECSLSTETPPRPPFRWVPISHLPQYPFPEANAPVLALLQSDNFPGHDLPGS
ncbi:MAG: NUDIX domain-containing protein, partial [Gemmatales bacterium]|nr:NUDIX domain-containing protein [Gemmatales bacterium]